MPWDHWTSHKPWIYKRTEHWEQTRETQTIGTLDHMLHGPWTNLCALMGWTQKMLFHIFMKTAVKYFTRNTHVKFGVSKMKWSSCRQKIHLGGWSDDKNMTQFGIHHWQLPHLCHCPSVWQSVTKICSGGCNCSMSNYFKNKWIKNWIG